MMASTLHMTCFHASRPTYDSRLPSAAPRKFRRSGPCSVNVRSSLPERCTPPAHECQAPFARSGATQDSRQALRPSGRKDVHCARKHLISSHGEHHVCDRSPAPCEGGGREGYLRDLAVGINLRRTLIDTDWLPAPLARRRRFPDHGSGRQRPSRRDPCSERGR